jgi:predicted permease
MLLILKAIIPVFALVMIGAFLRKRKFPGVGFWPMADKLTYFVLLPSLLIEKLALAKIDGGAFFQIGILLPTCTIVSAILAGFFCYLLKVSPKSAPSVWQGSIRPNTYVGLAAAGALFGENGLTLVALCLLWVVPLVNVLSVSAFAYYIPENGRHPKAILKNIFTNPLVLACLIGIFLNITQIKLPLGSADLLSIMSKAALPLGLLSVGNGLQLNSLLSNWKPSILALLLKLVFLPLSIFFFGRYLEISEQILLPVVLVGSVPCAVSSYILAGQLKGNQPLMARIITLETLLAIVTMPFILYIVSN